MSTFLRVLFRNGFVPPRRWPQIAMVTGAIAARTPFSWFERLRTGRMIKRMGEMQPPIFIVGHWRSGTTHLYNVMSRAPHFGYVPPLATGMPWDVLCLVQIIRPFLERMLPKERFIDPIPVTPDAPQEDEAALANMQPLSFYHGLYFPKKLEENFNAGVFFDGCGDAEIDHWKWCFDHFLRKMHILHGGRRIVIKNPVYTARVDMLRAMYPGAKFVHIYRNPIDVFRSMQNFYTRLLHALALQDYDEEHIDELILSSYPRMMNTLAESIANLPANEFVEISYEALDEDPLAQIEQIYTRLEIDGFDDARQPFETYLKSIQSYKKNSYEMSSDVTRRITDRWAPFFERWGYTVPT